MNDIKVLEIPKWGLSMEEGTVVEWLIAEGDAFEEGQEVCEIESSKIVNVLEAPFSGTLRRIIAGTGETLPVQAVIAVAAPQGVSDDEIDAFAAKLGATQQDSGDAALPAISPAATAPTRQVDTQPARSRHKSVSALPQTTDVDIPASLASGNDDSQVHATPRARALAQKHGINLHNISGTGRNDRISTDDVRLAVKTAGGTLPGADRYITESLGIPTRSGDDSTVSATPLARRVAIAWGLNLNDCRPSGRNGRVVRADVEAARNRIQGPPDLGAKSSSPDVEALPETDEVFEDAVLSGMRKTIGARLQQSKQTAPHYRLTVDCRVDALLSLRKQINSENPAAKVSVNDFIVKAAALALVDVPECNIQFNGDVVRRFKDAHVSVAVALDSGLITPIVRSANTKGLIEISNETTSLVTRAKANTLKAEDFQGGTFTVSNLGMFGIRNFDAIINPPQAAIMAVGAGDRRVIDDNGTIASAVMMTVTLSSDHRVIDGALGAKLLASFRGYIEKPARLLS